jgi:hypothetical protein
VFGRINGLSTQNLRRISGLAFLIWIIYRFVSYLDIPKNLQYGKAGTRNCSFLLGIAGLIIGAVQFLNGGASTGT